MLIQNVSIRFRHARRKNSFPYNLNRSNNFEPDFREALAM
jgi:hypothetical protein